MWKPPVKSHIASHIIDYYPLRLELSNGLYIYVCNGLYYLLSRLINDCRIRLMAVTTDFILPSFMPRPFLLRTPATSVLSHLFAFHADLTMSQTEVQILL
ncbi:hypothetical protein GDO78_012700 [Eleutherodactylus coqui]|uniref:Uncharacterized protein n=1 Tax=Eleutherodactylus coqui TaxID=57060 RepID=A0A8J6K495_ELECQ|nr:hypothetical protein GDO78_012700 [Eleutherodactylus coqui]